MIKTGARRSVWVLPDVDGGVVLKHFAVRGAERWTSLIRGSRARTEYRRMEDLCRLGVSTVRPMGFAERRRRGRLVDAWFVGRLIPGAETLGDAQQAAFASGRQDTVRRLAERSLSLAAELHQHPFLHRDLHVGNLLLDAEGRLLITDLHSVWRVLRLTRAMRVGNLARLLFSMRGALDLAEAPDLIAGYARAMGDDEGTLVAEVQRAIGDFERDYLRGRTARCLRRSSLFVAHAWRGGKLYRRRVYEIEQLSADLSEHERRVENEGDGLLGDAPQARVSLVGNSPSRIVKEYRIGGWSAGLRQAVGRGRARSAWVGARRLEVLGLPTPQALALWERRDGTAVLVTRALEDATQLRELAKTPPSAALRSAVARSLGHLVARLARAGVRHADLSAKNVLLASPPADPPLDRRGAPPADLPIPYVIDLDSMRSMPTFDEAGLEAMLTQLADLPSWVGRSDRQRFARAYERAARRALPVDLAARALGGARRRAERRGALARPEEGGTARLAASPQRAPGAQG